MRSLVSQHREEIAALCRRYGVLRLDLFGSGATEEFDPQRSDLDFLVDFGDGPDLFDSYFGLKEALERLFGRNVDLVMVGAMKNPYFIESVNKTRQPVYAAEVAQTA
ncbi:MAG: nucleotidyltransferase domain-containing protein [Betaproteobacteria bacterium]|nr:nucleotidyltransferase domain-containing protein [Betaproteobacteria bacterium]